MDINAIKQELFHFIKNGNDGLLIELYTAAKEYTNSENDKYAFSNADIEEFEKRSMDIDNGLTKTYSWAEAKQIITGKSSF